MGKALRQFIAAIQFTGSVVLMALCVFEMLIQPFHVVVLFLYLLLVFYASFMAFFSLRLWNGRSPCYGPSAGLWLAQIPIIYSSKLSFHLATGVIISAILQFHAAAISVGLDTRLAEKHVLFFGGLPSSALYLGVNVFAIFCAGGLLNSRRRAKRRAVRFQG